MFPQVHNRRTSQQVPAFSRALLREAEEVVGALVAEAVAMQMLCDAGRDGKRPEDVRGRARVAGRGSSDDA